MAESKKRKTGDVADSAGTGAVSGGGGGASGIMDVDDDEPEMDAEEEAVIRRIRENAKRQRTAGAAAPSSGLCVIALTKSVAPAVLFSDMPMRLRL